MYLTTVQGIDDAHNDRRWCVALRDLFVRPGSAAQQPLQQCVVGNYMIDLSWLMHELPQLFLTPCFVFHGERDVNTHATMCSLAPPSFSINRVHVPPFGTHHSKFFLLFYSCCLRVVILTANLIPVDWAHKSQGVWFQDFPLKSESSPPASDFETRLLQYLQAYNRCSCSFEIDCKYLTRLNQWRPSRVLHPANSAITVSL